MGLIFTRSNALSQLINGALARVGASTRRIPVTHAEYPAQRLAQRLDLAHPAAFVGLAGEQVLAEQLVLLGDGVLGRHVDDVDVVDRLDGVAGADGLHEVVAGVEEQHVDARPHLGGQRRRAPRPACSTPPRSSPPKFSSVQRRRSFALAPSSSAAPRSASCCSSRLWSSVTSGPPRLLVPPT